MNIQNSSENQRFEYQENGETAFLSYEQHGNVRALTHTVVPPALAGKGIGSALTRAALDDARQCGLKIRSYCSFIDHFLHKNSQYQDLIA